MSGNRHRGTPLRVTVTRDGVLAIEIGIDTLVHAFLASTYAWQLTDPERTGREVDPRKRFKISSPRGFAREVKAELLEEAEDGSSLLTDMLDKACEQAIENGSQYFDDIDGDTQ